MTVNENFWKDKKVFLTGHTGFKGGWLSLWLSEMGAQVHGYALEPSVTPNIFEEAKVASVTSSEIGDIRDCDKLCSSVKNFAPDIVIHMAAQALVRYSYDNPIETYDTNVMGTMHVLEAIRRSPCVKAAVMVTTDKCYENKERDWGYREDEPMGGHDPYSSSKGCMELLISSYRRSYFCDGKVRIASARAGNVIGGGDWSLDRLLPDLLSAFENNKVAEIRSPKSIRPWQHVLEPLSGYLVLAEALYNSDDGAYQSGWNFGPDDKDAKPVSWIADKICAEWGDEAKWEDKSKVDQPHEAQYLKLDCSKAKNNLNWHPKLNIDEAIELLVSWHKAFLDGSDMKKITISQIHDFIDKA
jgi:CDP-glucose 4,6-dehydratase